MARANTIRESLEVFVIYFQLLWERVSTAFKRPTFWLLNDARTEWHRRDRQRKQQATAHAAELERQKAKSLCSHRRDSHALGYRYGLDSTDGSPAIAFFYEHSNGANGVSITQRKAICQRCQSILTQAGNERLFSEHEWPSYPRGFPDVLPTIQTPEEEALFLEGGGQW